MTDANPFDTFDGDYVDTAPAPAPTSGVPRPFDDRTDEQQAFQHYADLISNANRSRAVNQFGVDIKREAFATAPRVFDPATDLYSFTESDAVDQVVNRKPSTFEALGLPGVGRGVGGSIEAIGGGFEQLGEGPVVNAEVERSNVPTPGRLGQPRETDALGRAGRAISEYGSGITKAQPPPTVPSYTNIKSVGDAAVYIWEGAQEAVGSTLPMIAGGVVAGVPGAVLAGWGMGVGDMRRAIEQERDKLVQDAMQARALGLTAAADRLMQTAAKFDPKMQAQVVYAAGSAIGMLDSVMPASLFAGTAGREVKQLTAQYMIRTIMAGMVAGAGKEGLTEAMQQAVQIAGIARVHGMQSAAEYAQFLHGRVDEIIDAGLMGAAGGGLFGAASGTKRIADARSQQRLTPGLMDSAKAGEAAQPNEFDALDEPAPPALTPPPEASMPEPDPVAPDAPVVDPGPVEFPDLEAKRAELAAREAEATARLAELENELGSLSRENFVADTMSEADRQARAAEQIDFEDIRAELPVDQNGDPDVARMSSALERFGGRAFNELSPAEVYELASTLAPNAIARAMEQQAVDTGRLATLTREVERLRTERQSMLKERGALVKQVETARQKAQQEAAVSRATPALDTYLAQGGTLSRSRLQSLGVSDADLVAALEAKVASGELRKNARGEYRRNPIRPGETARAADIRQEISRLAAEIAPLLPRGVKVKSFSELADLPGLSNRLEDRDGRVVTKRSNQQVDAFEQDGVIWLATYALESERRGKLHHEALHALARAGVVKPEEMSLLAERARKTGVFPAAIEAAYRREYAASYPAAELEARINEEAAAHLIEARANGASYNKQINAIIDRVIEFLRRLGNALRAKGYRTTNDVVEAFLTGEMAQRVHPAELQGPPARYPSEGDVTYAMRAYHGTDQEFDKFMPGARGAGVSGSREGPLGVWMTDNAEVASNFADWASRGGYTPPRVIPVDVDFKNPLVVSSYSEIRDLVDRNTKFERPGQEVGGRQIRMSNDSVDYEAARQSLLNMGYDGIILRQSLTDSPDGVTPIDQYVAIKPGTVRSAITGDLMFAMGDRPVTPGLDMSPEARKQRAEAMGFDTSRVWFHGTTKDFSAFDLSQFGTNTLTQDETPAIFFTSAAKVASGYAEGWGAETRDGANVMPVYLKAANFDEWDLGGGALTSDVLRQALDEAKKDGRDGVVFARALDMARHVAPGGSASRNAPDVVAVFDPKNIRSINAAFDPANADSPNLMFAMGEADRSTGQSMRRDLDSLGYYSKALEAARSLKQAKGTPEQMLAQLKSAGVKDAEIEATGLKQFLGGELRAAQSSAEPRTISALAEEPAARKQKTITKDEIVKFLESNRVSLREVVNKKEVGEYPALQAARDAGYRSIEDAAEVLGITPEQFIENHDANPMSDGTKWSSYSLDPSNPTYRETVLYLPESRVEAIDARLDELNVEINRMTRDLTRDVPTDQVPKFRELRAEAKALSDERANIKREQFRSGHFPEPNIIGHLMTSMTKHEGKPVYTIDQIQSDWGQKLRDQGDVQGRVEKYRSAQADYDALPKANGSITPLDAVEWLRKRGYDPDSDWGYRDPKDYIQLVEPELRRLKAEAETMGATTGNPLVNTTDQWVNTTLRRALRQAAEADADYIAIPHGDTVLSYNPGDTNGMRGFYGSRTSEGIVPKNLRKLLVTIDKESPKPVRVETLETSTDTRGYRPDPQGKFDKEQTGFTLFPLTDTVKRSVIEEGQPMFAFGGERARTADLDALAEAKRMAEEGASRDDIWTATGWFRGKDGKWRFEIDDYNAQLIGSSGTMRDGVSMPIADFYRHPELYGAYADLAKTPFAVTKAYRPGEGAMVRLPNGETAIVGGYDPKRVTRSDFGIVNVLPHELQHMIQEREGMAVGGSAEANAVPMNSQEAWRARLPAALHAELSDRGIVGKVYSDDPGVPEIKEQLRQRIEDDSGKPFRYRQLFDGMDEFDMALEQVRIHAPEKLRQMALTALRATGADTYNRLAGEVEARTVQARMNMTPEERRARPPWLDYDVPESEQIVRFGSEPMFAMGEDREPVTPGLDMSPEARKQRAEAMGFDTGRVWYHGSSRNDLDVIEPGYREPGAWFTTDLMNASNYAKGSSPMVYDVYLRTKNPFVVEHLDPNASEFIPSHAGQVLDFTDNVDIVRHAQRNGYDSVHFPDGNFSESGNTMVVFDAVNIRSVNAAFDPANSDSPNLMFAMGEADRPEVKSLQSIVSDLATDLGLTIRQGLSRTATGRAASRIGLNSVFDPATGVIRVRSVSDARAVARAAGSAMRHRLGQPLDAVIAANADDLLNPLPPTDKAPAFAPAGYSGLALSPGNQKRAADAAMQLVRMSMLWGQGREPEARRAEVEADRAVRALRRRLGDSTASAVIKDTLGGLKAISPEDQMSLLTVGDMDVFNSTTRIRARLEGMPNLPNVVRTYITQGRSAEDMRQRAKAVALEAMDAATVRRALATFEASNRTAGDLALMLDTLGMRERIDLMGDGSPQAQTAAVDYVRNLAVAVEQQAFQPAVIPSLRDVARFMPDPVNISARIARRFTGSVPVQDEIEVPYTKDNLDAAFDTWFSTYLMNPDDAGNRAPYLMADVEALIDAQDPILLAKLESSQEAIQAYFQANPVDAVSAMVQDGTRPGTWDRFAEDRRRFGLSGALSIRLNQLYTATIDRQNGFTSAVWELLDLYQQNTGTKIDIAAKDNPAVKMRLAPHSHAWATRDMEEGVRNYLTNEHEGPGLIEALKIALGPDRATARDMSPGSRYDRFRSYLVARYAAVEWARFRDGQKERAPTVMPPGAASPDQARQVYENVRAEIEKQFPEFAQAADQIYAFQRNLLKLQRDAGLITPELYDRLVQDTDYVPFYRVFDEAEAASNRTMGNGGAGGILKRKAGSERDIIDPIASIAQKMFETRQVIATNDVKRSLIDLAEKAGPGGGMIAERIDPKRMSSMGVNVEQVLQSAAREAGVDPRDRAELMDVAMTVLGNDAVASYYTQRTITPGREPITFFWDNGELQALRLGNGGQGHELAAMMMDVLNTFGKTHVNHLMNLIAFPAHITRLGVTTHPEFAAANLVRDALMAYLYDPRATPFVTQIRGMIDVGRNADYVRQFYATAGMMGGEATSALDKLRLERDTRALIERGYKFKTFDSLANWIDNLKEITEVRHWLDRVSGAAVGGIAGAAAAGPVGGIGGMFAGALVGGKALVKLGEVSETATRARLWKHAYERGIANGLDEVSAAQEAAFWSHDYTDYSRKGSKMDGFAAAIPFLNANLQGNDTYLRRLLGKGQQAAEPTEMIGGYNPGILFPLYRLGMLDINKLTPKQQQELGLSAHTWAMTILGLGSISLAFAMLGDDDERLKDIDDRTKASHWIFAIGDTVYRIPKPFQTVWFSQLVERFYTEARHNNPRWFEHYVEDLWNTWKPPMVPAAGEVLGTYAGIDFNTGRQVIPDHIKRQDLSRPKQFDAYTSDFGKWVGERMGTSPLIVDHMIHKFGASWGRTFTSLNMPGLPWFNEAKPKRGIEEEFIARRFMWKVGRGSEAGQAIREIMGGEEPLRMLWDRFAQPASKLAVAGRTYRDMIEAPTPKHAEGVEYLKTLSPYERGFAILDAHFRQAPFGQYRMLHPMNRAETLGSITLKMEKEIVGGELLSGRKGTKAGQKELPMSPNEKAAARDILTQYRMMETHNALVLTGEKGWAGRMMFDTEPVLRELRAAAPAAYKELMTRFDKQRVLPWAGIAEQWPKVKAKIEDEAWIERVRTNRVEAAKFSLVGEYVRAQNARLGGFSRAGVTSAPASAAPAN